MIEQLSNLPPTGYIELECLKLTELTALRWLTLRMGIDQVSTFNCGLLLAALSTIASSVFCEFVFELGGPPPRLEKQSLGRWDLWTWVDGFLEERFVKRGDFKLLIKRRDLHDREKFRRQVEGGFPLLMGSRGRIYFETSHSD